MSFITQHFPVFEKDPFLQFRPFPAEPTSLVLKHWHEIFVSFVFYTAIQIASGPLSRKYLGTKYTSLSKKTRINFDIHVVSMVQCVISIGMLIPMWNHSHWANRSEDPVSSVLGYTPYGGLVAGLTVGYFLWDVVVCLKYFSLFGFGFLFHGCAALFVFSTCFYSYAMPWIPAFLLFELSTPFVNINWFASRLPAGTLSNRTVAINGIMLLLTFFSVRIVWGFYSATLVATDMLACWSMAPIVLPVTILLLNVNLDILNCFWFYKMLLIAKKQIMSKKSPLEVSKEETKKFA
jgi:hypothetical protein